MPRRQAVPQELKQGPVTIAYAEAMGFSRQRFRGPNWKRVGCGTYVWAGLELAPRIELAALHCRLPQGCVFSGSTAARLHGIDTDGNDAVEVTVPLGVSVRARTDLRVHAAALDSSEVTTCGSLPVTTPLRTCFDLARRLPLVEAVAALDRLCIESWSRCPNSASTLIAAAGCWGCPRPGGSSSSWSPTLSRPWNRGCG